MRPSQSDRTMRASVLREILLMIFFRAIERWCGLDLRDDRSPKTSALFQLGQFGFSGGFFSAHGFTIKREANRCNRLRLTSTRATATLCRAGEAASPNAGTARRYG